MFVLVSAITLRICVIRLYEPLLWSESHWCPIYFAKRMHSRVTRETSKKIETFLSSKFVWCHISDKFKLKSLLCILRPISSFPTDYEFPQHDGFPQHFLCSQHFCANRTSTVIVKFSQKKAGQKKIFLRFFAN